jgi:ribonuclease Z
MKLTFLGTGAGAPSRHRNVSAVGLQFSQESRLWLFDCGEGTQQQILRSPLKLSQLERVFITHMHGDHLYGLPGLLASRSLQQAGLTPVTVYGPPGIEEYLNVTMRTSQAGLGYPLSVITAKPGVIYEDAILRVECAHLEHRITTFGYAVIEKPQKGRFKVEEAAQLGITPGPIYGKLKAGQVVTLDDGRIIDGQKLVGADRPGRKIVYCCDTVHCQASVNLGKNADILIHEATFAHDDLDLAIRGGHTTARQAAEVAGAADAKTLIMTHFSVRYDGKDAPGVDSLLHEAQEIFPRTYAAHDFWSYNLKRKPTADEEAEGDE